MIKKSVKNILSTLSIDITRNQRYDRLTTAIMKRILKADSNCIDIGCHKGEMLIEMLHLSPEGKHYAFEPIPDLYNELEKQFQNDKVSVFNIALSNHNGEGSFHLVRNAPEYSGIKKRKYDTKKPDVEKIKVKIASLDDCIPEDVNIDFIKIDVEGGEFEVLKGSCRVLKASKPCIVFEFGLGAADYYGSKPSDLYRFLTIECEMNISTLDAWLNDKPVLTEPELQQLFDSNKEYYFIAHPF